MVVNWSEPYHGMTYLVCHSLTAALVIWPRFTEAAIYSWRTFSWVHERDFYGDDHTKAAKEWAENLIQELGDKSW